MAAAEAADQQLPELPDEVVCQIYAVGATAASSSCLALRDRARGRCVCSKWRDCLGGDYIPCVELNEAMPWAAVEQLMRTAPAIGRLFLRQKHPYTCEFRHLLPALCALCLRRAQVLECDMLGPRLDKTLPVPHLLAPQLRHLAAGAEDCAAVAAEPHWLASLAQLPNLQRLELRIKPASRMNRLPQLAALTALRLATEEGFTVFALSGQPALEQLEIVASCPLDLAASAGEGDGAAAGARFPALRHFCVAIEKREDSLTLDFAQMPQLRSAWLFVPGKLGGGGTVAVLERLELVRFFDPGAIHGLGVAAQDLDAPGVLELLRALPPSVRGLGLDGYWTGALARVLGQATQLRALELVGQEGTRPVAFPPPEAPLWRELRALSWRSCAYPPRPQREGQPQPCVAALRHADKLAILQLRGLSYPDADVLAGLPGLESLFLPGVTAEGCETVARALVNSCAPGAEAAAAAREEKGVGLEVLGGGGLAYLGPPLPSFAVDEAARLHPFLHAALIDDCCLDPDYPNSLSGRLCPGTDDESCNY